MKLQRNGVRVDGVSVPFWTRDGVSADAAVLTQVFSSKDYRVDQWAHGRALDSYFSSIISAGRVPFILDGGANIGASALYFSMRFPGAEIVAVEPDASNCEVLRKNTEGRSIKVFEGALAGHDGSVHMSDPGRGEWGFRASSSVTSGVVVKATSIPSLLDAALSSGQIPLLCKIDVEGGESELFDEQDWMQEFPVVMVELHDWMLPFQGTSRGFLRAVSRLGFDVLQQGENTFAFNPRFLKELIA